jgi:alkylhydroperoxidase family enzyme
MIRSLILKRLDKEEQSLGESLEYVRHILRTSLPAFFKFALFTPLSQHRRKLPPAPYRVARIVATRDEDCGSCVQIEVNLARRDGVPVDIIRAVVNDRPEELTPELADVYGFTKAVVEASGEEEDLRQRIRDRYGEEGLVELALGMAAARLFPITKRALGYAISCALVDVKASPQE